WSAEHNRRAAFPHPLRASGRGGCLAVPSELELAELRGELGVVGVAHDVEEVRAFFHPRELETFELHPARPPALVENRDVDDRVACVAERPFARRLVDRFVT